MLIRHSRYIEEGREKERLETPGDDPGGRDATISIKSLRVKFGGPDPGAPALRIAPDADRALAWSVRWVLDGVLPAEGR